MSKIVYNMEPVNRLNQTVKGLDCLILASGSDNRAYEVLKYCDTVAISKVIIINFSERLFGLKESDNLYIYKKYSYKNLQEISCEIKNPSSCLDEIIKTTFCKTLNIGIDISCLTKPYFFFIIKLLKERFGIEKLSIFYTEPKSYLFNNGLFNAFHTSSGPLSILEIPGYSGQEIRGAKRKLIILLGFDGDLSKEINEDVSPHDTIVVNGFPSYTQKFKDISLIANEKLVSDHNISVSYARANNPFDTYNLLQFIKNREKDNTFINVAPLGKKPMALGACLFALHYPDVRIIYPLPETYENKYSDMSWNSWSYNLPLFN